MESQHKAELFKKAHVWAKKYHAEWNTKDSRCTYSTCMSYALVMLYESRKQEKSLKKIKGACILYTTNNLPGFALCVPAFEMFGREFYYSKNGLGFYVFEKKTGVNVTFLGKSKKETIERAKKRVIDSAAILDSAIAGFKVLNP